MTQKIRVLIKRILYYFLNTSEEKNNVLLSGFSRGLQNVAFAGQNAVPDRCNFSGNIKIGYATTLGVNNFMHGNISIGKYCQFGADVAIHTTNHPIHYLSSYINKNLFSGELKKLKENKEIFIGNDVWIGHNALIIGGVTIGNGAIIAAGTVVTKNVEPYSIVAGVPSKVIKKRFTNEVIQEIEKLEWWHKTPEELDKIKPLFFKNFNNIKSIYEE
ncbi:CatB-related O-acetyltransferase [Polaribacter atrinae]|uniref:CatB-related O-acetyltransferase n=1 Tax=Polaribacter atrinae TaxID=1333662 RepID=UPI0024904A2E|nr:CatB-related O-acetyltransferase [Polaribacter atrinae]